LGSSFYKHLQFILIAYYAQYKDQRRGRKIMIAYKDLFDGNLRITLKTATKVLSAYPASASAFMKLSLSMKKAEQQRKKQAALGVDVPPLMIVSTTDECNLACKGCYACELGKSLNTGLPPQRAAEILDEASELGISIVLLAGGEPLLSHGWLDAMTEHPEMAGLVFSNGTLLDDTRCNWFAKNRHLFPVLSIEGDEAQTDSRRGDGVYAKAQTAMSKLHSAGVPFGVSITVTSNNINDVLRDSFIAEYIEKGCRLFIFVEYVPIAPGTDSLILTKTDKTALTEFALKAEGRHDALCIAFPGDESLYGGCLAAGRGFINISTSGDLEPCPFAPFSDVNLRDTPLKEALKSKLLRKVRENHDKLIEGDGGCALWHNREWLETLVADNPS
jgi:MoaA/NifB/PqqE/SkfB family radical SAM enzyme